MFALTSQIKIGEFTLTSVNGVTINRSFHDLGAKAVIKLPVTSVLKQKDKPATRIETASQIKVGDRVEIYLGYNGKNELEFRGYVKRLNYRTPLEIECEDIFYKTRIGPMSFSEEITTLKQCLSTLLPKLTIGYCVDLTLKNFVVKDKPGSWVLDFLKKEYGLTVFFDINEKLYVCRGTDIVGETIKYQLDYNVIKSNELIYELTKDNPFQVKAICYDRSGEKLEAESGNKEGATKTLYFYDVEDKNQLLLLAQAEHMRYSYDGYKGKIETFLQPYALPGMVASIKDVKYPEREGDYLIESTQVTFNDKGARRMIEIGIKV